MLTMTRLKILIIRIMINSNDDNTKKKTFNHNMYGFGVDYSILVQALCGILVLVMQTSILRFSGFAYFWLPG